MATKKLKKLSAIEIIIILAIIFLLAIVMSKSSGNITALFSAPRP
jgi:hypothetical protein